MRADLEIAEKRRRERREAARKNGKTVSKKALLRDGWHLMLTNIPEEQMSVAGLAELYRVRWAIEIQFRAWKQSTKIEAAINRRNNSFHIEALVCASMIVCLLGLRQIAIYAGQTGLEKISPEKLMGWLTSQITGERNIENLGKTPPELKHIQRDQRKRQSTILEGLNALN